MNYVRPSLRGGDFVTCHNFVMDGDCGGGNGSDDEDADVSVDAYERGDETKKSLGSIAFLLHEIRPL